jgi:hypothetical protein
MTGRGNFNTALSKADETNLIARFAEDLAKRKINPCSNSYFDWHRLSSQRTSQKPQNQ